MLKKSLSLILTFEKTTQAMACERFCQDNQLPGRLIPVPREITAGCGLAWKAPPGEKGAICAALDEAKLSWAQAYILEI